MQFLKIQVLGKRANTSQRHTFSLDEERGRIVEQIDLIDHNLNDMETEEYFPCKYHTIDSFAVNFDRYMSHPLKIWSDEDLAEQIVSSYMFDENIYD